jgi:hypothetical protein
VEFYSTCAVVIPVLLLALVWDYQYLRRVAQRRKSGRWAKWGIAVWSYFSVGAALLAEGICLLILSAIFAPGDLAKGLILIGLAALIGSMWTRMYVDIHRVTEWPKWPGSGEQ